jgi:hypothetical protein
LCLSQFGLQVQALGQIAAVRDEVRDSSFDIPHRRDAFFDVVQIAILLPVDKDAAIHVPGKNGAPQLVVHVGGLLA